MITVERVLPSGAYIVSALVQEGGRGLSWLYTRTYYGYPKSAVRALYRESLADQGYTLARE
jgi:hypothetical protein